MMQHLDLAVIGSGIGGSLIAALNRDKKMVLFERDRNLGGCASTFKRFGNLYNAGATTFMGYENGHLIKAFFDQIGAQPKLASNPIAMRIVIDGKSIDRTQDFETFLEQIDALFPNSGNRVFWTTMKELDEKFWQLKHLYFAKYSLKAYLKSARFFSELVGVFGLQLFQTAQAYIDKTLGDIPPAYQNLIDAGLLITVQSEAKNVTLLSMALGLAYPFHEIFYAYGGMGAIIDALLKDVDVHKGEAIEAVTRYKDRWIVQSADQEYEAAQVVLNSSVYQNSQLFSDRKIQEYYNQYQFSDQSAFVVYMTLQSSQEFLEHYQFILDDFLPNSISQSFFVSFSRKDDSKLSKKGYSITISTHTKASFWRELSKQDYELNKQKIQDAIVKKFLAYFEGVGLEQITQCFSATSTTFQHYISRYNCGGKAINIKNIGQLPSCTTPFKGLYNVGDTVFAGQGWPGVALGVSVLHQELNSFS